jgi:hypothetical protein
VYNFYNTETVVDESENNAIWRYFKVGPSASKAIYTTFNSLNVMCLAASSEGQRPESKEVLSSAPK